MIKTEFTTLRLYLTYQGVVSPIALYSAPIYLLMKAIKTWQPKTISMKKRLTGTLTIS